jgi:hypothetical protein
MPDFVVVFKKPQSAVAAFDQPPDLTIAADDFWLEDKEGFAYFSFTERRPSEDGRSCEAHRVAIVPARDALYVVRSDKLPS